jgi:hypothetical protein
MPASLASHDFMGVWANVAGLAGVASNAMLTNSAAASLGQPDEGLCLWTDAPLNRRFCGSRGDLRVNEGNQVAYGLTTTGGRLTDARLFANSHLLILRLASLDVIPQDDALALGYLLRSATYRLRLAPLKVLQYGLLQVD